MASSQHVAIRKAVAALLTGVAGGRIHQNRTYTLATGVESQVHVNLKRAEPNVDEMFTAHPIEWFTDIEIRIKARAAGGLDAEDVADAIWQQVYQAVMSAALPNVTGREPGAADFDDDDAEVGVASITWIFTVRHSTTSNVLT